MKPKTKSIIRSGARWLGAGIALAFGTYAATVAITWCMYDRPKRRGASDSRKSRLDEFIPEYEVVERHSTRVRAPAGTAFAAACAVNFQQSAFVRAIFKTRELILGSEPSSDKQPLGLVEQAKAWGWGILAEEPGREIVFGGVTQPWLPDPKFRALPAEKFREFSDPDFVKIAWTIRVDPVSAIRSVVSTETRVATTDPVSRAKFRKYWSFIVPGSALIRRLGLRLVKVEAERRARAAA